MAATYIAEHVPWYQVDRSAERPWRDEDVAMSAPAVLYRGDSLLSARLKISEYLDACAEMNHAKTAGEAQMFERAASMFRFAPVERPNAELLALKIHGRFYRIRMEES